MLEKYYKKTARPLALLFGIFGIVVVVDFLIPRSTSSAQIDSILTDSVYHPRYSKAPSYTMRIANQTVTIDHEATKTLSKGQGLVIEKTMILRRITSLIDISGIPKTITVYVAPYTYFPLYPILFLLPFIFTRINRDSIVLMAARPLSLFIALISLIIILY